MSEAENLNTSAADETDKGTDTTDTTATDKTATIVDAADDITDETVTHPATWPQDWREKMAGKDEKLLARLKRFSSPEGITKSWINAEKKINSGQVVKPLAADATDEEKAAWRTANGVPDSWDKYDRTLSQGQVLGEEDKPVVDSFLKFVHEKNFTNDQAKSALEWYYGFQDEQTQARFEADETAKQQNMQLLREEYGQEFKGNLNAVRGMMDAVDENLFDRFFGARDPEGMLLGNDPTVIKFMVDLAKSLNPAATLIPGDINSSGKALDDEISSIEQKMRTDMRAYWKDPKLQERYSQLLSARERIRERNVG